MADQIQKIFFGKETISGLNKVLLQQPTLKNLSRDSKQELINILIKNMKIVYKLIDTSKINNSNFTFMFDQFKKYAINETLEEINNTNPQNSAELKFKRDFSYPTNGNKIMDRPTSSKNTPTTLNQKVQSIEQKRQEQRKLDNPFAGFDTNISQDTNFDNVFKPMINEQELNSFNNHTSGRTGDIDSKMSDLKERRQYEESNKAKRPSTPDFLKSKKTNPDKVSEVNNAIRETTNNNNNIKSSEFTNSFNGLSNDLGGDLFSLDNIDKPLIDMELPEDTSSFDERLKKLQSDRDNIKSDPNQQKDIDFSLDSKNFIKSENMNNNMVPQKNNYEEQSSYESSEQPLYDDRRSEQIELQKQQMYKEQMDLQKQQMYKEQMELQKQQMELQKQKLYNEQLKLQIEKQKKNTGDRQLTPQQMQIIQKRRLQKQLVLQPKLVTPQINTNNILKENNELKLYIEKLKQETKKPRNIQMEVSNNENKSLYTWELREPLKNVTGIKLLSYSIPENKFNIEENKNNTIIFNINSKEIKINITTGKYNIEELINNINSKISEIKLSLNYEQKVIAESDNEFSIISTFLSKENLGFLKPINNMKMHVADRAWDLRIDNKVYLFLNNLSETIPFGILYNNRETEAQFNFEEPYNLQKLDICFKDSKGFDYNFYGLSHNLSFLINLH